MPRISGISLCVVACSWVLSGAPVQAAQPPAGSFYQLNVTTSFEPSFKDCWSFASNGRVIISHAGGLGSFPYQLTGLNSQAGHFQAAWRGGISIGFSGVTSGGTLSGDAVDTRTHTYRFTGTQVAGCGNAEQALHGFAVK
jgi:hypothetical protein